VARGDWATVYRHLIAIGPAERHAYEAMAQQAARLTGRDEPSVGPTVGGTPQVAAAPLLTADAADEDQGEQVVTLTGITRRGAVA